MTASAELLVSRRGRVLELRVDRPQVHNALSREVLLALGARLEESRDDPSLACVVLRASGSRYFAAGGDIRDLDASRDAAHTQQMLAGLTRVLDQVRDFPLPVVAVLNGDAIGGGAELAVACDFRVARRGARLGYIHGRLHITAAWGGATDLIEKVGSTRALRMMTRTEMVDADTALSWGLVDEVADEDALDAALDAFLAPLLALGSPVLRSQTALVRAARRGATRAELRLQEAGDIDRHWQSEEHWAVVDRFLGRRDAADAPVSAPTPSRDPTA